MNRLCALLAVSTAFAMACPAAAQDHSMHDMPGMPVPTPAKKPAAKKSPAKPAPAEPARRSQPAAPQTETQAPQGDIPAPNMPDAHAGHAMAAMPQMEMTGTALPAGNAPAPAAPRDHFADRQFSPAEMAASRAEMMREQGGLAFGQVLLDLFEYRVHDGRDGYRWDGEAFYGGDRNRVWIKSEGEGELRRGVDTAEVHLLYNRAIGPYFNLQAGVRQDLGPLPDRTYAAIGFEGLAPGMFKIEGAFFLSDKGETLGRIEGYHDLRITQRLIFQPRIELNLAAQDIAENNIGSGLVNAEFGLRLRYELSRRFAPYLGVSHDRKGADTARFARTAGEDVETTSFVAGVRFWF